MKIKFFVCLSVYLFLFTFFSVCFASEKSIRFDTWVGPTQEALEKYALAPFTAKTGAKVEVANFIGMDQFLSQVKASFPPGGEYNVAHLSSVDDYMKYIKLGFGAELDESKIPNLKNVMPAMIEPLRKISDGKLSAVPYDFGQTGIAYNTKYVSKEMAEKLGVALLWEESLKGKIGMEGDWRSNIWYASLFTGQDPNNIDDIEKVWDALKEQKKLVRKYWFTGAEWMHLFANEEIHVGTAWSGRVYALQQEGLPIEWLSFPGIYSWMEYMFVLKGTDMDLAHELLNYMLEPKPAIEVAIGQNYPPSLNPTKVEMPEYIKKMPGFDPSGKMDGYLFADPNYWGVHFKEWAEKWERIMIQQ